MDGTVTETARVEIADVTEGVANDAAVVPAGSGAGETVLRGAGVTASDGVLAKFASVERWPVQAGGRDAGEVIEESGPDPDPPDCSRTETVDPLIPDPGLISARDGAGVVGLIVRWPVDTIGEASGESSKAAPA